MCQHIYDILTYIQYGNVSHTTKRTLHARYCCADALPCILHPDMMLILASLAIT